MPGIGGGGTEGRPRETLGCPGIGTVGPGRHGVGPGRWEVYLQPGHTRERWVVWGSQHPEAVHPVAKGRSGAKPSPGPLPAAWAAAQRVPGKGTCILPSRPEPCREPHGSGQHLRSWAASKWPQAGGTDLLSGGPGGIGVGGSPQEQRGTWVPFLSLSHPPKTAREARGAPTKLRERSPLLAASTGHRARLAPCRTQAWTSPCTQSFCRSATTATRATRAPPTGLRARPAAKASAPSARLPVKPLKEQGQRWSRHRVRPATYLQPRPPRPPLPAPPLRASPGSGASGQSGEEQTCPRRAPGRGKKSSGRRRGKGGRCRQRPPRRHLDLLGSKVSGPEAETGFSKVKEEPE